MKKLLLFILLSLFASPLWARVDIQKDDFWSKPPLSPTSGSISQLTVFPYSNTVGARTTYRIEFLLTGETLTPEASLQLYFPSRYVLTGIDSAAYSDDDPGNIEYIIADINVDGRTVSLQLSSSGEAPAVGGRITLKLFGVNNATVAAAYQLALAIVSAENELIAPPTWSSEFSLTADETISYVLYPQGFQQMRAGTVLQYHVETHDRFHNATPPPQVVWSVVGAPTQAGTIVDGSFQAQHTGASKIAATSGSLTDTSSLVYVFPGAFSHLEFNGGPDSVIAGQYWSDGDHDLIVTAYDLFENVDNEFEGEVYFRSSDTIAETPYPATAPYRFIPADQGRHLFPGSGFRFFTAGRQSLDLMRGNTVQHGINSILVLPAAPSSFQVVVPDTVTAGEEFLANATEMRDQFGNPVSGLVTVALAFGSGVAPSGTLPSLPSFFVTGGSGSASCVLVKAGADSLRFSIGGIIYSQAIMVVANSLAKFDFALDALQPPGRAFVGTARLIAYDAFGNTVNRFSAAIDPVTISCSGAGTVLNNRIDADGSFVNGVCDLTRIGTGYSGNDLYVTFNATSLSGKRGASTVIGFSFLKITGGSLVEETGYVGDKFTFKLTVSDFGNQSGIIDSIRLYLGGARMSAATIDRAFPDTLSPLSNRVYTFVGDLPNRPGELLSFAARLAGRIGNFGVTDSVGGLASLRVLSREDIGVVAASLSPTEVKRGQEYVFALRVYNNGGDDLYLTTSTRLKLGPSGSVAQYALENPVVIPAHGGIGELKFARGLVPPHAPELISDVYVQLIGTLGSLGFEQAFSVTPAVVTQSPPASYQVSAPDTVMAGHGLAISVTGTEDQFGNPVSGLIAVRLASGSGMAPSGVLPSLPSISVTNGSGSGSVVLVRVGVDSLEFELGGVLRSHAIYVQADSLARFDFALDAVQPPGRTFVGTARLTAYDRFDNVIDWFDAALDPITITSSGAGAVLNGNISNAVAFVGGVCDLKAVGVGYSGSDLYVTFTATSQSGKRGTSPAIGFSFLKITAGSLVTDTKYVGEQYVLKLTISNFGNQSGIVDSVRLYIGGTAATAIGVDRTFPDTLASLSNRIYTFVGDVPNRPGESLNFAARFNGRIGIIAVSDSVDNLASLTVLSQEGVGVAAGSLAPSQVTRGRDYAFALRVYNNSGDDLRLTTSTRLLLGQSGAISQYLLESPVVVTAHGGEIELKFVAGLVPLAAPDLISEIHIQLTGTLGSVGFDQALTVASPIVTQSAPVLRYQEASLTPTTMFRGRNAMFALDVENVGSATLSVDVATSELVLYATNRRVATAIDAAQLQIPNGVAHLSFKPVFVPADFPTALDSIRLQINGVANGHTESARINLAGSAISIPAGAAVQLVSTKLDARNAPHVNIGQLFLFKATIRNQGDEPLRQVAVKLQSDGESLFADSISIDLLPIAEETTLTFAVTAAIESKASELFSARVVSAIGVNSGLPAQILPALNSTQAVVIQTPANLLLVSAIASPTEAQDGVVTLSSSFIISANVSNRGQADVGVGEVSLREIGGSFILPGQLTQTFDVGQNSEWQLTAPVFNDTGRFEIAITSLPEDDNSGIAAKVINRTDTITVIASEQQVAIGIDFEARAPALLATGGTYDLLAFSFDVLGRSENPYLKYIDLALHDRADREVDPASILSAVRLRFNDLSDIQGVADGNRIRFALGDEFGVPEVALLTITLRSDPELSDAAIYLDSNSFAAEYATSAGLIPVPISARFASRLVIRQELTLVPTTLAESFFSYPNPFSPPTEQATIVFSATIAKPATLRILTLTGEEVFYREISAEESIIKPVEVPWDGRNKDGNIVLNGVYIAVLTVEGLPDVKTKIAVVK